MKTFNRLLITAVFATALFILSSCEKNNISLKDSGTAEFSISIPPVANARAFSTDSTIQSFQILISVSDLSGKVFLSDSLIPVYTFGTSYVSENIKLPAGEFLLTKFMFINTSGAVIYAAPVKGSPLAYLCSKPLPLKFSIMSGQTTKIAPEVLLVGDQTPDKFGYAVFGIQVIKPLDIWVVCTLDNPLLMAPVQFTSASLTISAVNGWHFIFKLEPAINHLIIRGGSDLYSFLLSKDGYASQKFQFTATQLLSSSKENPLMLKIPFGSVEKVLVLQPGPEAGKDAMISNLEPDKNFGSYKYFEATYLSEPVMTVMRSNRSLISFSLDSLPKSALIRKVILKLSYDIPVPFDNSYITDTYPTPGTVWYGGVLRQITEPWDENKVTWNSQPATIETNQVFVPPFIRNTNVTEIDVTKLIVSISASPVANYGMLFKLWPVDRFPGFRFASSDFATASMRPMLRITYIL